MDRFYRELERLDRTREELLQRVRREGVYSVPETVDYIGRVVNGSEAVPIMTSNCRDLRNDRDVNSWYLDELNKIMRHYSREYDREECRRAMYGYYGYGDRQMIYEMRKLEVLAAEAHYQYRKLDAKERYLRDYEHHIYSNKPSLTSLPPPAMCGTSTTVVQKARDLFLAKDEKILRKSGLKDQNGNWTNDSIRVFVEMLLEDPKNKKQLLDLAKELTKKKKDDDSE